MMAPRAPLGARFGWWKLKVIFGYNFKRKHFVGRWWAKILEHGTFDFLIFRTNIIPKTRYKIHPCILASMRINEVIIKWNAMMLTESVRTFECSNSAARTQSDFLRVGRFKASTIKIFHLLSAGLNRKTQRLTWPHPKDLAPEPAE